MIQVDNLSKIRELVNLPVQKHKTLIPNINDFVSRCERNNKLKLIVDGE